MVLIWNELARGDAELCAVMVAFNSVLQIVLYAPLSLLYLQVCACVRVCVCACVRVCVGGGGAGCIGCVCGVCLGLPCVCAACARTRRDPVHHTALLPLAGGVWRVRNARRLLARRQERAPVPGRAARGRCAWLL
jgi:hypothetical protein